MPVNDPLNDGSDSEADGNAVVGPASGKPGYRGRGYNTTPGSSGFRGGVNRVVTMAEHAMDQPGMVDDGLHWYGDVHDAIRKDIGRLKETNRELRQSSRANIGLAHGAGIVAAVSPNMDFENSNINALSEIGNLTPEHWEVIGASAAQPRMSYTRDDGTEATKSARRSSEAQAILLEHAPSLAKAPDRNLMNAHAILTGADFNDVLNRRTAPKTNSFAWDLLDPSHTSHGFVTIDGRQADIIANRMRPWTWSNRGISSAALPTGGQTRYEDHEAVMHAATSRLAERHAAFRNATPADVQAVTWLMGQHIERMIPKADGGQRVKGVARRGQPYLLRGGRPNDVLQQTFIDHL